MRERRARFARALILFVAVASPLAAQSGYPHIEDASAPHKGMFRVRAATLWTRYDARFAADGTRPLGALFSGDSAGVAQFPDLAPFESRVASATGSAFALSLGRARVDAVAREEV